MINSTISFTPPRKEVGFPKLMKNRYYNFTVFFHEKGAGTVVHSGSAETAYRVGVYSRGWDDARFADFEGHVLLENAS